jgi:hypothetical protein
MVQAQEGITPSEFLSRFSPRDRVKISDRLSDYINEALGEKFVGRRAESVAIAIENILKGTDPSARGLAIRLDEIAMIRAGLESSVAFNTHSAAGNSEGFGQPLLIDDIERDLQQFRGTVQLAQPTGISPRIKKGTFLNPELSTLEVHQSIRLADILNRLASENGSEVFFRGRSSTSVSSLLQALAEAGVEIRAFEERTFANFLDFVLDDEFILRWPLWVDTGLLHEDHPVTVPAGHSQWVWHIRGEGISAHIAFFRGTGGVRFVPRIDQRPEWTGLRQIELRSPISAIAAAEAYFKLNLREWPTLARGLPMEGYGLLGTCNDSIAALNRSAPQHNLPLPFPLVRDPGYQYPGELSFPLLRLVNVLRGLPHDVDSFGSSFDWRERVFQMNPFFEKNDDLFDSELKTLYQSLQSQM